MELISPFSKDSLFLEANVYNSEKKEIKAAAGVHREHAFFNAQSAWVACESFQLSLGNLGGVYYRELQPEWFIRSTRADWTTDEQINYPLTNVKLKYITPTSTVFIPNMSTPTNSIKTIMEAVVSETNSLLVNRDAIMYYQDGADQSTDYFFGIEESPALNFRGPGYGKHGISEVLCNVFKVENIVGSPGFHRISMQIYGDKQSGQSYLTLNKLKKFISSGCYMYRKGSAAHWPYAAFTILGPRYIRVQRDADEYTPVGIPMVRLHCGPNEWWDAGSIVHIDDNIDGSEERPAQYTSAITSVGAEDAPWISWYTNAHSGRHYYVLFLTVRVHPALERADSFTDPDYNSDVANHGYAHLQVNQEFYLYSGQDRNLLDNTQTEPSPIHGLVRTLPLSGRGADGTPIAVHDTMNPTHLHVQMSRKRQDILERRILGTTPKKCYSVNELFEFYNVPRSAEKHLGAWVIQTDPNGGFRVTIESSDADTFEISKEFADELGLTDWMICPNTQAAAHADNIHLVLLPVKQVDFLDAFGAPATAYFWEQDDNSTLDSLYIVDKIENYVQTATGIQLTVSNIDDVDLDILGLNPVVTNSLTGKLYKVVNFTSLKFTNIEQGTHLQKAVTVTAPDGSVFYQWTHLPKYSHTVNNEIISIESFSTFSHIQIIQTQGPVVQSIVTTQSAGQRVLASLALPFEYSTTNDSTGAAEATQTSFLADVGWSAPSSGSQWLPIRSSGKLFDCVVEAQLCYRDQRIQPIPVMLGYRGAFTVKLKFLQTK